MVSRKEDASTRHGVPARHTVPVGLSDVQLDKNKYIHVKFQERRNHRGNFDSVMRRLFWFSNKYLSCGTKPGQNSSSALRVCERRLTELP